jgi:hypothetical protein
VASTSNRISESNCTEEVKVKHPNAPQMFFRAIEIGVSQWRPIEWVSVGIAIVIITLGVTARPRKARRS